MSTKDSNLVDDACLLGCVSDPPESENQFLPSTTSLDSDDKFTSIGSPCYVIPFDLSNVSNRWSSNAGECIQGNHGACTHTGSLKYAFDFRLPVGTPILAARTGVVAAAVAHFDKGGLKNDFRPRANFIAIQHADGTYARYFHLQKNGCSAKVGDQVIAGQQVALSGNTGFSSCPHLHFDVTNMLPEDTCHLDIRSREADGAVVSMDTVPAVAAAFSTLNPQYYNQWMDLSIADPPHARHPLTADVKGTALWVHRGGGCGFKSKAQNAQKAGADCLIVVNSNAGPETFSMGGLETLPIPAVLVAKESHGIVERILSSALPAYEDDDDNNNTNDRRPRIEIRLRFSKGFLATLANDVELGNQNDDDVTDGDDGHQQDCNTSILNTAYEALVGDPDTNPFMAETIPIQFRGSEGGEPFVCIEGRTYPRDTDNPHDICNACCSIQ